ncbi:hypothetical protein DFH05DRAFT_1537192 [Lentinula detonsa]|uniref:CxC1-like cysteine cluster associated with KDZ transposases domain-containing protein n=1 Tax=Lentinula detonsa TaxID=2804962 RepID=A0A9W8NVK0_9AGAR|nr:hypothetical protein DFH05DRAFT_1537192 [Lentinula detonsa]
MTELVDAYMDYCNRCWSDVAYDGIVKEKHRVMVWSIFDTYNNTSYIRSGYLPFNPLLNKSVVSFQTIELCHHLFMRCPRLGIQPFVRALCDLQGVRFKNNLSVQISAAYDLYICLVEGVRLKVRQALGRDALNWRMLNNCPCCQYEVVGEPELAIQMLLGIDSNNSLKRFQRREPPSENGKSLGPEKEREDNRVGGGDYFLQPEAVDLWDESQWHKWPGWTPKERSPKIPCKDRWSYLKESNTHRTFGHFDVNGVFGGFCRHSFTIVFLDMIRTGEHSKYMLALLNHFMSASREDRQHLGLAENPSGSLGVGYDIAFGMTAKIIRSPLNDLAQKERLSMMIGIEDLEVCERYFAQSNALAPVTRYMGKFRCRQAIANYAYHRDNFENYHNLSRFIVSNYKQALGILGRSRDTARALRAVGLLDVENAAHWLDEEKAYLESRQKLNIDTNNAEQLVLTERQMVNKQEMEAKLLLDVQSLEERLGLRRDQRWKRDSEAWNSARELVEMANWTDKLEGLTVARIFELSKMNMRQHIGDAMKKSLEEYNACAASLKLPRKLLDWDDILNYTYLSEFDFLRDSRADILDKPWAKPAVREAMSELFKLIRAGEEIDRLHVEIKRLLTYMKEEEEYFATVIWLHGRERSRFNEVHQT